MFLARDALSGRAQGAAGGRNPYAPSRTRHLLAKGSALGGRVRPAGDQLGPSGPNRNDIPRAGLVFRYGGLCHGHTESLLGAAATVDDSSGSRFRGPDLHGLAAAGAASAGNLLFNGDTDPAPDAGAADRGDTHFRRHRRFERHDAPAIQVAGALPGHGRAALRPAVQISLCQKLQKEPGPDRGPGAEGRRRDPAAEVGDRVVALEHHAGRAEGGFHDQ